MMFVFTVFPTAAYAAEKQLEITTSSNVSSVVLSWKTVSGEKISTSTVYRFDETSESFTELNTTPKTSYTDSKRSAGKKYTYKIVVKTKRGKTISETAEVITPLKNIIMPAEYHTNSDYAYCETKVENNLGTLTYHNCNGDITLYQTDITYIYKWKELSSWVISKDGTTVFYGDGSKIHKYTVYDNKDEIIYEVEDGKTFYLFDVSSDGGYCAFNTYPSNDKVDVNIYHDGVIKTDFLGYQGGGNRIVDSILANDGTLTMYISNYDFEKDTIGKFSFSEGKKETLYEMPRGAYGANNIYMYETGLIAMQDFGKQALYCASPSLKPKKMFSGIVEVIASDGESLMVYDSKTLYRVNIATQQKYRILSVPDDCYSVSSNLETIVYVDNQSKKIVRMSDWNEKQQKYSTTKSVSLKDVKENLTLNYPQKNALSSDTDKAVCSTKKQNIFIDFTTQKTVKKDFRFYLGSDSNGNTYFGEKTDSGNISVVNYGYEGEKYNKLTVHCKDGTEKVIFTDNFDICGSRKKLTYAAFDVFDFYTYDYDFGDDNVLGGNIEYEIYHVYYVDKDLKPVKMRDVVYDVLVFVD